MVDTSKIRINDLARELEVKSRAILEVLEKVGVTEKKTHSSSLEEHEAVLVRKHFQGHAEESAASAKSSRAARPESEIKTKIDLSHISRPGDVLRAIQQKEAAAQAPPPRPTPVVPQPPAAAKAEAPVAAIPVLHGVSRQRAIARESRNRAISILFIAANSGSAADPLSNSLIQCI